jgi:hypothetical protein
MTKSATDKLPVKRIVSGGQTGVDRGALDAAIEMGIEHGGWCPRGRLAEDGTIPPAYALAETVAANYAVRTEQNVIDSDGTLILYRESLSGGTELTRRLAERHGRPHLLIELTDGADASIVGHWLIENEIATLNVAGPRESTCPGIAAEAYVFMRQVLADQDS